MGHLHPDGGRTLVLNAASAARRESGGRPEGRPPDAIRFAAVPITRR